MNFLLSSPGSKNFSQQGAYNIHKASVHVTERNFKCDYCSLSFKNKFSLKKHRKKHISGYDYICSTCGAGFRQQRDLDEHIYNHTGERPYKCPECDKDFRAMRAYRKHVKFHTGDTYNCEHCGKAFAEQKALRVHMQVHGLVERTHSCTYEGCSKAFYQKSDLQRHTREVHMKLRKSKSSNHQEFTEPVIIIQNG